MSRIEQGIPSEIDLSIDPAVIEQANRLLGAEPDINRSKNWLQSKEKSRREKRLAFFLFAITSPALVGSYLSVLIADGAPVIHKETVAFLGPNNRLINKTEISKIRSLKRGAHLLETDPFSTTAFQGGRKKEPPPVDPRAHSKAGKILRRTGADEIPQTLDVLRGRMALIGPRGYTLRETEGLNILFEHLGQMEELRDYQQIMAEASPRPGVAGLYAAIYRKDLTVSERLMLDRLYCLGATREGDNRIFLASLISTLKMTGAR